MDPSLVRPGEETQSRLEADQNVSQNEVDPNRPRVPSDPFMLTRILPDPDGLNLILTLVFKDLSGPVNVCTVFEGPAWRMWGFISVKSPETNKNRGVVLVLR